MISDCSISVVYNVSLETMIARRWLFDVDYSSE